MIESQPHLNLLNHRLNHFSQNGEDGIIDFIFRTIGPGERQSCEFGAWDGIHFSNCRKLVLEGWGCVMIEGDESRFRKLCQNYKSNPKLIPMNCFVNASENSVDRILERCGISGLDLLSIDIDGLDYEIMASLILRPRVICIEVNAGHDPKGIDLLPREIALRNVGQSLGAFTCLANQMGYGLVCYNGNAFFVRNDCMADVGWVSLTAEQAYDDFIAALSPDELEWLFLVNLGKVAPFYNYGNDLLSGKALGISPAREAVLVAKSAAYRVFKTAKGALN